MDQSADSGGRHDPLMFIGAFDRVLVWARSEARSAVVAALRLDEFCGASPWCER
jgi:hypothetical protein